MAPPFLSTFSFSFFSFFRMLAHTMAISYLEDELHSLVYVLHVRYSNIHIRRACHHGGLAKARTFGESKVLNPNFQTLA